VRIFEAEKSIGMDEEELKIFLVNEGKIIQLGTLDMKGDPNIHPTWYYFDPETFKLYFLTGRDSRKERNLRKTNTIYFNIDTQTWPNKGARGKGRALSLDEGIGKLLFGERILKRYVKLNHSITQDVLDSIKNGSEVVIEIMPSYFSTWDYAKRPQWNEAMLSRN
jgi:hypothetical protein